MNNEPTLDFSPERLTEIHRSPVRQHAGDCGYDLFVSKEVTVLPYSYADVPHNIKVAMPHGSWGFLVGRSSTFRNKGLLVLPGIIDNGYRGELFAMVYNPGQSPVTINLYERIAQLILVPMNTPPVRLVAELPEGDDRGSNGFGSTDRVKIGEKCFYPQGEIHTHREIGPATGRIHKGDLVSVGTDGRGVSPVCTCYLLRDGTGLMSPEVMCCRCSQPWEYLQDQVQCTGKGCGHRPDIGELRARFHTEPVEVTAIGDDTPKYQPDYTVCDWDADLTRTPSIVCLCGSTKFWREFIRVNAELTIRGNIVLSVGCDMQGDDDMFQHLSESERARVKDRLDQLHMAKIRMADQVHVLNVGGYIGQSTTNEIRYAVTRGLPVTFLHPELVTAGQLKGFGIEHRPAGFSPANLRERVRFIGGGRFA